MSSQEKKGKTSGKTTVLKDHEYYANLVRLWDRQSQNRPHATGIITYTLWARFFRELPPYKDEEFQRGAIWA